MNRDYDCKECGKGKINVEMFINKDQTINVLIKKCNHCNHQYQTLEEFIDFYFQKEK